MILDEGTKEQVKQILSKMTEDVNIVYVNNENAPLSSQIKELLTELTELNEHLKLKEYKKDDKEAKVLGLEDSPAVVLMNKNIKGRIVYYGIPSGYEFANLLDVLVRASNNDPGLTPKSKEFLDSLTEPIKLNVFVTPQCPHCPTSASIAFRYAMYSDKVTGQVIEAQEFPEWSNRFKVMGVPKTVVNDKGSYVGGYPEEMAVDQIKQALTGKNLGE